MWSAIPLKFKIIGSGIAILIIATFCFFWVRGYNEDLRIKERVACNADWVLKNAQETRLFDEKLEKIRTKQKSVKPSPSASAFSDELQAGRAFNPFLTN